MFPYLILPVRAIPPPPLLPGKVSILSKREWKTFLEGEGSRKRELFFFRTYSLWYGNIGGVLLVRSIDMQTSRYWGVWDAHASQT